MDILPSTQVLRTFETAAQLLNFTRTAEALNLTQGAVSHQMRELETLLDTRLFERKARGLALSDAGRAYLPFVQEALERLRAGAHALRRDRQERALTVTMSPNFANKWLVPRLGDFADAHPEVDLRISALRRHVDFAVDDIDLGIRHGTGDWPQLHVTRLCPEWYFPVCSPSYAGDMEIQTPRDLQRCRLLHDQARDGWREWFRTFEVEAAAPRGGPIFSDTSLAIDAAVSGQGVALARSALAALDLRAGRLVRPVRESIAAPISYWLVCPKATANAKQIGIFRDWLLAEAAKDQAAAEPLG
ncbi:MAG: transcriptional regulator GcvA [Rhodospirillaceae bacterium]|nr:transcriptional regulator GcvA [Rhodospirillaceae bacterium]MDD9926730.1 transcriptional regulator GcvA [Rhodospirillaceae bacterium]